MSLPWPLENHGIHVVLRHYQDAYASLVIMFGSTATLPPRTKRWAEAKVLADSINIKVCRAPFLNKEQTTHCKGPLGDQIVPIQQ